MPNKGEVDRRGPGIMRQRTKREQRERIEPRAPELAKSGEFQNWLAMEHHLRFEENCREARHVLDNERIREELDRLCEVARDAE